jgi:hypothetical protein
MSRADVIAAQHTQMIWQSAGAGQVIDSPWYGNKNGGGFLEKVIVQEAADALSRCVGSVCPIDIEIMIDKGLITSGMLAQSGTVSGVAWSNAKALPCDAPGVGNPGPPTWDLTKAYSAGAFVTRGTLIYVALSANTNQDPTTATSIWETNTQCVVNSLKAAMDHIDGLWGNQVYYAPSPNNNGHHGLLTFLIEGDFLTVNWGTVWSTIASYQTGTGRGGVAYKHPYDIFHWRGGFIEANQAGAYIWSQIQVWDNSNPSIQYKWDNGNAYQANFYNQAQTSSQTGIGTLFAGYDGSNNNYNNRVMSRQCGNVLLLNSKAIFNAKPKAYSAAFPLLALVMQTFNDLGETNLEGGEDPCWRTNTPTYAAPNLSFQVVGTNPSGALTGLTVNTIDHFKIMFGDGTGPLFTAQDNITPTAAGCTGTTTLSCSFNLNNATLKPFFGNTWFVYVKMIPKALMLTEMNGAGTNQAPLVQAF